MKIFTFFIMFIFISNISLGFDLKKLGDSLQKDLGGALKELEKGLNQQGNTQNNNSRPKLENDDKAVAKIINNLCVITYTASNGKKFERKSTAVNNCERDRRSFLLNDAKQIEKDIAYNKRMEKERKEREILQAKQREEERKRQQAEKQRKIAADKKAKKIEGFNDEQSAFIHDAIAENYVNYRNLKAICLEKGSAPYANEVKKIFNIYKKAIKLGELKIFPKDTNWDKLSDAAWKVSTPKHEQYLKENQMTIGLYDSMTDSKRVRTCLNKVVPQPVSFLRMMRKKLEKSLNKKDVKKEKKAF